MGQREPPCGGGQPSGKAPPVHAPRLPPPPPLSDDTTLFLDFDGTLVELAAGPDEVHVLNDLPTLLADVSRRLDGRLAIVSGRSVEWLAHTGVGDHALSGTHGSELRLAGGPLERPERPAALDDIEGAFQRFADDRPGVIVERKTLAAGLHFRRVPEHEEAAHALAKEWGERSGLAVQPGKMMVELRLPGGSKGTALAALMEREPFAGGRPVFLGDDVTDEDGFRAAREAGGLGVLVGPTRDTAATHRLAHVAAVHAWLRG